MHFKHRIAKRTARYAPFAATGAAAFERAGVRATYRLHDRLLSNPRSRRLFESHPPHLDEVQRRIVSELDTDGLSMVPFVQLFPERLWDELDTDASEFIGRMEHLLGNGTRPQAVGSDNKPFGRRFATGGLTLENPWLRLAASSRVVDIVNSYLGLWSKLTHADQWYSPPLRPGAARVGSMRWHRDYNDRHLVKVFIYLCDVDERAGPLEYVPGSTRTGPYVGEWPWEPLSELYPAPSEFERRIPRSATRSLTGPRGTVIFCNTSGFHRGGYVTDRPRSLWVFNYVSPAATRSLVERNFQVGSAVAASLSEVERFAVS